MIKLTILTAKDLKDILRERFGKDAKITFEITTDREGDYLASDVYLSSVLIERKVI